MLPLPPNPNGALWPHRLHAVQESVLPGDALQRSAAGPDQCGPLYAGELARLVPEQQAPWDGGLGLWGSLGPGAVGYHSRATPPLTCMA